MKFPLIDGNTLRVLLTKVVQECTTGQANYLGTVKEVRIGQSAAKLLEQEKVQRLTPYQRVHSSEWKWGTSRTDEDIV